MKLKTRRAAAKRFKLSGTGRIRRRRSHHTHILTKKSRKRKRHLNSWAGVSEADKGRVSRMLGLSTSVD